MNDLQGFISSGSPIDPRSVVRKAQLRGWRFDHAPTEQSILTPYHYRGTTIQCPVMDLTEGYQSYIKAVRSKSKTVIAKSARQKRALERELGPVWVEWNSSCPEHFGQLIAWKSAQHQRMNTRQLFSDPTALRIVDQLARTQSENCSGIVTVLHAGEQPVAVNLGILGPHDLSGWFLAYDQDLNHFSPGTMMFFAMAEEAANRGVDRIDLGYGQHSYKFRLATGSYPVAGGAVWASRAEDVGRSIYRRLVYDTTWRNRIPVWHRASAWRPIVGQNRVDLIGSSGTVGNGM